MMGNWTSTSIAAYLIWWGIALAALAALILKRRTEGPGGRLAPSEVFLALVFNAVFVALLGGVVLPRTLRLEGLDPSVPWLLSLPYLAYGLAGFGYVRRRVKAKRTALARAIAVYAFSTAGHLVGVMLLLGYLRVVSRSST